jgi:hypothetical protein
VRIENTGRPTSLHGRSATRAGASGFFVADQPATARSGGASGAAPSTSLDALLALQSIDDPVLKRRKAIRRGNALLDALEAVKADLLLGRVSEGRLNQLLALISTARDRQDADIDSIVDDIELRARVELAKFGRYPAA